MKIAVVSYKGGVGKTSIAYSLAVDLDYKLVTNDLSNILQNYSKASFKAGSTTVYEDTVYDFAGYKDEDASVIINQCDIILIPTIPDANSLLKSLMVMQEFKDKNMLVVANMIENEKDKEDIKKIIHHHFPNVEIHYIKRGKLFKNASEEKLSATQLYQKDNFNKYVYGSVFKDYLELLKRFAKSNS